MLLWGIGSGVATAGWRSRRRSARGRSSPRRATRSSSGRARSAPTRRSTTRRRRASRRSRRRPRAKASRSCSSTSARRPGRGRSQAARAGGRIVVCGATSGPNPPAALHRIWWKQLTIYGSTMGTREDFEAAYELVKSGRAKPVVDSVLPAGRGARRPRADGGRRAVRQDRAHDSLGQLERNRGEDHPRLEQQQPLQVERALVVQQPVRCRARRARASRPRRPHRDRP